MLEAGDGKAMLEGIKIVDLTTVVFGPYCTQLLADLGAEVIKVEAKGGDAFRYAQKWRNTSGMGPGFLALNHSKKSVELDLKDEDDLAAIKHLLAEADVFVTNVRGKGLERLGLDEASVRALSPDIIYAHCVGFAQDGPYADLQAYDDVIQALSGTATLLPRVDGDPRARYLPSLIADKVAGQTAAYGVLGAIVHRLRTGEGQRIEIPMFEAFTSFMLQEHLGGLTFDPPNDTAGYARQVDPDRQPFPTSDGYISIVPYTGGAWDRVFEVLGDEDFLKDERFKDDIGRFTNVKFLYRRMAELTPNFSTDELARRFQEVDIPAQPVRDLNDVMDDPHLRATDFFERVEHPTEGPLRIMRPPVRFGAQFKRNRPGAPTVGQHNDELKVSK